MPPLQIVTVALDGSALAERALPHATWLAQRSGARLQLVRVLKPWPAPLSPDVTPAELVPEADVADANAYLHAQAAEIRALAPGVDVQTTVRIGDPADEICAAAGDSTAQPGTVLLVLTTHGRSGLARTLWGSVADQMLRHATVPILLLPRACAAGWQTVPTGERRVLVTLDGSALAEAILAPAGAVAAALNASLLLARVVLPLMPEYMLVRAVAGTAEPEESLKEAERYLDTVAERLRGDGMRVETHALLGSPITAIMHLADLSCADVIAMATHGRGGAARMVFGSVATGVLQRATVPLLVLRPIISGAATTAGETPAAAAGRSDRHPAVAPSP